MADCRTCPSLTLFRRRSALAKIPAQRCAAAWANVPNSHGREEQPIFKYFFGWFRLFRLFRLSWFSERHQFLLGKGITTPGQQHTAAYIPLPMWRCHVATLPRCHIATLPRCHVATLPGDGAQHSKGMQPRGHRGASIALWIGQQATWRHGWADGGLFQGHGVMILDDHLWLWLTVRHGIDGKRPIEIEWNRCFLMSYNDDPDGESGTLSSTCPSTSAAMCIADSPSSISGDVRCAAWIQIISKPTVLPFGSFHYFMIFKVINEY